MGEENAYLLLRIWLLLLLFIEVMVVESIENPWQREERASLPQLAVADMPDFSARIKSSLLLADRQLAWRSVLFAVY